MPPKQDAPRSAKTGSQTDALWQFQASGFDNLMQASTSWMETMSDMGSEVVSFIAERIREDVNTQHAMMRCKDLAEFQHIQAEFIQKAIVDYQKQTGKLVDMSMAAFTANSGDGKS